MWYIFKPFVNTAYEHNDQAEWVWEAAIQCSSALYNLTLDISSTCLKRGGWAVQAVYICEILDALSNREAQQPWLVNLSEIMWRWWIPLYGSLIWLEYLQNAIKGVMDHGGVDAAGCLGLPIVQFGGLFSKAVRIGFLIVAAGLSAFCHLERACLNWHIVSCYHNWLWGGEEKSIAALATWCSPRRYIFPKYQAIYEVYGSSSLTWNCLLQIWTQKNAYPPGAHTMSSYAHQCFSAGWRQTAGLLYLCICSSYLKALLKVSGRHDWGTDIAFNMEYYYPDSKYTNTETAILLKHTYAHRHTHSWVKIYTGPRHAQT